MGTSTGDDYSVTALLAWVLLHIISDVGWLHCLSYKVGSQGQNSGWAKVRLPRLFLYPFGKGCAGQKILHFMRIIIRVALCFLILFCVLSCGAISPSTFNDYVRPAAQMYQQSTQGGTYVGVASSQSEAQSLARRNGYSHYQWYPSTGYTYGYK